LRALDRDALSNGLLTFLLASTGPLAILLGVATRAGLERADIVSWIFAAFVCSGALSIVFCALYRQPAALAWSIPGSVLVGPALGHFTLPEVVGAYFATGALIVALGFTGWVGRVMAALPLPIVMAMVAGVFLPFGVNAVAAFEQATLLATAMAGAYVAALAAPRLGRLCPPVLLALAAGAAALWLQGFAPPEGVFAGGLSLPRLHAPQWSAAALAELVLPLTVTVIGVQNAQGFFILRSAGYRPAENALTVASGAGSLAVAGLGAVPMCVAGPGNAILNSSGAVERRWIGGVVFGLLMLLFGLFAETTVALALAVPGAFVAMLGGLGMVPVLQAAFRQAFSGRFPLGTLVSFVVTVSGVSIYNIGAPFWALAFGYAASRLLERRDFRAAAGGAT
jgi:benzoate membrane transport protein